MGSPAIDYKALSIPERLQLVEDIWDSVAQEAAEEAFPMTPELAAELDRRLAEAEADPDGGIPWEVVRQRILSGKFHEAP